MGKRALIFEEENKKIGQVLLDWNNLKEACLGRDDLITKLLSLYVKQAPQWIEEIKASVGSQDVSRIRQICHTVKGATASLHAMACVNAIEALSAKAKANKLDELHAVMSQSVMIIEKTNSVILRVLDT